MKLALQHRQRLLREGLESLLSQEARVTVVGSAVTGDDLVALCSSERPDLAILELDVTQWDPCKLALRLRRAVSGLRFVGTHEPGADEAVLERARRAGLRHIVSNDAGVAALIEAAHRSLEQSPVPIRPVSGDSTRSDQLTSREVDILELIAAGCTSREISSKLSITYKTVENHKQRIFCKLGVQNQSHAVVLALRRGLLGPGPVIEATANR